MEVKEKTSEIFLLIIGIFISLLILTIIERNLVNYMDTNKKTNILYYKRFFDNITKSKIVLNVTFFTIIVILINPVRLITIFNPYIFNVFGSHYSNMIKYVISRGICTGTSTGDNFPEKYIDVKPYITSRLDKTIDEIIFNKKNESVYKRILEDFNGDKETVCNLLLSINVDNNLSKINSKIFRKIYDTGKYPEFDRNGINFEKIEKIIENMKTNKVKRLDDIRTSKFSKFNSIMNNEETYISDENKIIETVDTVYILGYIFLIETIFVPIFTIIKFRDRFFTEFFGTEIKKDTALKNALKKVNDGTYYVRTDTEKTLDGYFIIFNLLIIFLLIQLLNDKQWLDITELDTSEGKKYTLLILFMFNFIPKLIYKYSKFVTLDTFILINISITVSNCCIIYYLKKFYDKVEEYKTDFEEKVNDGKSIIALIKTRKKVLKKKLLENKKQILKAKGNNDIMDDKEAVDLVYKLNLIDDNAPKISVNLVKHQYILYMSEDFSYLNILISLFALGVADYYIRHYYYKEVFNNLDKIILAGISYFPWVISLLSYQLYQALNIYENFYDIYYEGFNNPALQKVLFLGAFLLCAIPYLEESTVFTTFTKIYQAEKHEIQHQDTKLFAIKNKNAYVMAYPTLFFIFLLPISEYEGAQVPSLLFSYGLNVFIIICLLIYGVNNRHSFNNMSKHSIFFAVIFAYLLIFISKLIIILKDDKNERYWRSSWPMIDNGNFEKNAINYVILIIFVLYILYKFFIEIRPVQETSANNKINNLSGIKFFSIKNVLDLFMIASFTLFLIYNAKAWKELYYDRYDEIGTKKHNDMLNTNLYYIQPILLFLIIFIYINNKNLEQIKNQLFFLGFGDSIEKYGEMLEKTNIPTKGGGVLDVNTFNYKSLILPVITLIGGIFLYKYYVNSNNSISNKVYGGLGESGTRQSPEATDEILEIKRIDYIDSNIINLVGIIIILFIVYSNGLFYTKNITEFIQNRFLNYSNLNKMKLLVFPFIIISIFLLLFGYKVIKTLLVRQIEKSSIFNVEKNNSKTQLNVRESKLVKKFSTKTIDRKSADILTYGEFIIIKYSCIIFIISWYLYLIVYDHIELDGMLFVNLMILYIYIYFIQYVLYILYKIYINENVNKIEEEIKKVNKIKTKIKFTQGKVNPVALEEIVEINSSKLKVQFEEFMNTIYGDINGLLAINNIYLTSAIEIYIKRKLITHKPLEEAFTLKTSIEENRKIELEKRKKLGNVSPLAPIPENIIMKLNLTGKWSNVKDDNNIILYVYNNIGIVIYFNKKQYQGLKLTNIVQKSGIYEFIYNNELEFTYDNKNIIMNNIPYSKLSTEFSTDNIIKKTLRDNDVFKSLNYMITIDDDAKYIGKYNIIENLTKYNAYKQQGDPLTDTLEQLIMNKILLIKSIKSKKYKEADTYNKVIQRLEKDYKKRETYYKFDSNRDGTIDLNEVEMYASRNHKLSDIGEVKVVSATYHGGDIHLKFDKPTEVKINAPTTTATGTSYIPLPNADKYFSDNDLVVLNNNIKDNTNTSIIKVYANKIYEITLTGTNGFTLTDGTVTNGNIIPLNTTIKKVQYINMGDFPTVSATNTITFDGINKHFKSGDYVICNQNVTGADKYELLKINDVTSNTFKLAKVDNNNPITNISIAYTKIIKVNAYKILASTITIDNTIPLPNASSYFSVGDIVMLNKSIPSGAGQTSGDSDDGDIYRAWQYRIKNINSDGIKLENMRVDRSATERVLNVNTQILENTHIYTYKNTYYDFPITLNNNIYITNKIVEKIDSKTLKVKLIDATDKEIIEKKSNNKINLELNIKNRTVKLYKTTNNFAEFDPTIFDP